MLALFIFLAAVAIALWYSTRSTVRELRERIQVLEHLDSRRESLIRTLSARVQELESRGHVAPSEPSPPSTPQQPVVFPSPRPAPPPPIRELFPPSAPATAETSEPAAIARRTLRDRVAGQQWEELIGGNWLNKLGVLVLVIGIALGLAYSFTYMGPAGRVATALAVSAAMLVCGIVVERRAAYRVFARGLMGGGWAGLYFTAYAMYALQPAKVISSPVLESVLLAAVAAGMIGHSLRYRSQTVTALAYFLAFVAMAVAPVTSFAVVALLPLAASLLYLADRFSWFRMAVAGVVVTYAVCALRGDPHASLASSQALVAAYWALFEGFVLLRVRTDSVFAPAERWIFGLNTLGATVLSAAKWHSTAPDRVWILFASAAAIYLAGTIARLYLRPATTPEESLLVRALSGRYESAATVSALFAAISICLGLHGPWIAAALLAEGEVLFLLSLRFRDRYIEGLAMGAFGACVARIIVLDLPEARRLTIFGRHILAWTPTATVAGVLFYIDRMLRRSGAAYTWAAAGAFVTIALLEADFRYVGLLWLLFAAVNLEIAIQTRLSEFRLPAYVVGALGIVHVFMTGVLTVHKPAEIATRISLFCSAVLCYLVSARLVRPLADALPDRPRSLTRDIASCAGSVFAAALIWVLSPDVLVAVGWTALSVVLLEAGFAYDLPVLRRQADALALLAFGRLFFANFTNGGATWGISHRLLTVVPIIAAFCNAWLRYRGAHAPAQWERIVTRCYVWAATAAAVVLFRFELGRSTAVVGWAALLLALYWTGQRRDIDDFRYQALVLAALAFLRAWATNLSLTTSWLGIPVRVWTACAVAAALYAAQMIAPRAAAQGNWLNRHQRAYLSVLASTLVAILLFYESGGGLLTVAWGIEGVALLAGGFLLRDRILRLSALALFFICIGKLFVYDLRNLETIHRILSFIILGGIMVGVSWLYTRFRDQIRKLL